MQRISIWNNGGPDSAVPGLGVSCSLSPGGSCWLQHSSAGASSVMKADPVPKKPFKCCQAKYQKNATIKVASTGRIQLPPYLCWDQTSICLAPLSVGRRCCSVFWHCRRAPRAAPCPLSKPVQLHRILFALGGFRRTSPSDVLVLLCMLRELQPSSKTRGLYAFPLTNSKMRDFFSGLCRRVPTDWFLIPNQPNQWPKCEFIWPVSFYCSYYRAFCLWQHHSELCNAVFKTPNGWWKACPCFHSEIVCWASLFPCAKRERQGGQPSLLSVRMGPRNTSRHGNRGFSSLGTDQSISPISQVLTQEMTI